MVVLTYRGADFSSLPVVEAKGIKYSDGGSTKPFEQILASHGANLARIRVWTAGDYQLPAALKLATRAKAAGMKILVDLHYSDTCTCKDPFMLEMCLTSWVPRG